MMSDPIKIVIENLKYSVSVINQKYSVAIENLKYNIVTDTVSGTFPVPGVFDLSFDSTFE